MFLRAHLKYLVPTVHLHCRWEGTRTTSTTAQPCCLPPVSQIPASLSACCLLPASYLPPALGPLLSATCTASFYLVLAHIYLTAAAYRSHLPAPPPGFHAGTYLHAPAIPPPPPALPFNMPAYSTEGCRLSLVRWRNIHLRRRFLPAPLLPAALQPAGTHCMPASSADDAAWTATCLGLCWEDCRAMLDLRCTAPACLPPFLRLHYRTPACACCLPAATMGSPWDCILHHCCLPAMLTAPPLSALP